MDDEKLIEAMARAMHDADEMHWAKGKGYNCRAVIAWRDLDSSGVRERKRNATAALAAYRQATAADHK